MTAGSGDLLVAIIAGLVPATGMAAPDFEAIPHEGRKVILISKLREQGSVAVHCADLAASMPGIICRFARPG